MLIKADLIQVEIVILAQMSKDPLLVKLINEGIDIYKYFAVIMYNKKMEDITKEERNSMKVPILGISYGKGWWLLSQETGKSKQWCEDFIKNFYDTFPQVKILHDSWTDSVNSTGQIKLPTGMSLKFKKYPSKYQWQFDKGITESYNPPDIKNHPIQHMAFLVISMIVGQFFREKAIFKRDKYLLINTVHDDVMLDCKEEYLDEAAKDIQDIVDKIPQMYYDLCREKLVVPIRIEISTGKSWIEL